jgi:hypothetical protein
MPRRQKMETKTKREDTLRKIRAILDKANNTNFGEERDAFLQKADDLMLKYAIEEAELELLKPAHEREKPEVRTIDICSADSPIRDALVNMGSSIARHARGKPVFTGLSSPRKYKLPIKMKVVGFPSDLDYVEMLFTSLMIQMSGDLEPKPDPLLSYPENLAMLKDSGLKWERIHELLENGGITNRGPWERRVGVKFTADYRKFCEDTGHERNMTSPITYQKNFTAGFASRIASRLEEIRKVQDQHKEQGSQALVLFDRKGEVDDAFRKEFPSVSNVAPARTKYDDAARRKGGVAGSRADLGGSKLAGRKALT